MKRIALAIFAIAALAAVGAQAADEPRLGGILNYAVTGEPPTYDCHGTTSFTAMQPLAPHYSTLLQFDPPHYPQVMGDLAESWSVAPDGLTYSFKLRPNVKFHDGSPLTAEDIKATYERLRAPQAGVVSVRQATFEDISSIDTPDPLSVVFHLSKPDAAMLANFASPWNCVYSAAKLKEDPHWPEHHVMGSGPFRFVEHVAGSHWSGKRFEDYYDKGKPYLDGFRIAFISEATVANSLQGGQILAEFRGLSPAERDRLKQAMGDKIVIEESPWLCRQDLLFNTKKKPFDDPRVRRALSLGIDRWKASDVLSRISTLKAVGTTVRPGYEYAAPDQVLETLPGYGHDINAARAEARRLLKEAGQEKLRFKLLNRSIPMPYTPAGVFVIDQLRQIGVTAEHEQLETRLQKAAYFSGNYEVGLDGICDFMDEPNLQLLHFVSADVSPLNVSFYQDRLLDQLYEKQKRALTHETRYQLIRDFDQHLLTEAYVVPVLWWHRIVAHSPRLKGWSMTPSHYIGQNLASVWLAP